MIKWLSTLDRAEHQAFKEGVYVARLTRVTNPFVAGKYGRLWILFTRKKVTVGYNFSELKKRVK